jgi:hypothetical protein
MRLVKKLPEWPQSRHHLAQVQIQTPLWTVYGYGPSALTSPAQQDRRKLNKHFLRHLVPLDALGNRSDRLADHHQIALLHEAGMVF